MASPDISYRLSGVPKTCIKAEQSVVGPEYSSTLVAFHLRGDLVRWMAMGFWMRLMKRRLRALDASLPARRLAGFTFAAVAHGFDPSRVRCSARFTDARLQTATSSVLVLSVISVQRLELWMTPTRSCGERRLHGSLNVSHGCPLLLLALLVTKRVGRAGPVHLDDVLGAVEEEWEWQCQ